MANAPLLEIKNYRKHQHYHKRGAPWIKLYASILADAAFIQMPEAAQSQLMKLWVLASQLGHPLPNNPRLLAGKIGTTGKFHIATLIENGFLIPCEKALEEREQNASIGLAENGDDASALLRPRPHSRESNSGELRVETITIEPRVVFCAAANRGLAEHPTRPQTIPLLIWSSGKTLEATDEILAAGVPIDFAESAIYEAAKSHVAEGKINSLKYFIQPTLQAWKQHTSTGEMSASTPRPLNRNPRRQSPGEDSYAAGRAAFEIVS